MVMRLEQEVHEDRERECEPPWGVGWKWEKWQTMTLFVVEEKVKR